MAVGRFFFSAAPTAQTSPELHFRCIDSFLQPSLLESLLTFKRLLDLAQTFAEGWFFVTLLYNRMTVQRNEKQISWALARCSAIKLLGGNCEQANEISCGAH